MKHNLWTPVNNRVTRIHSIGCSVYWRDFNHAFVITLPVIKLPNITNAIKNNSECHPISIDAINDEQKLAGS